YHRESARLGHRVRVGDHVLGRVAAPLHPVPAEHVLALRGEADVRHHRDPGRGHGGDLRGHPPAALQLHRVPPALLEEPAAGAYPTGCRAAVEGRHLGLGHRCLLGLLEAASRGPRACASMVPPETRAGQGRVEDVTAISALALGTVSGSGRAVSRNRLVIGSRRSRPKALIDILVPGAACRRLYSARSTMRSTRSTSAGSCPAATSPSRPRSPSMYPARIASSTA